MPFVPPFTRCFRYLSLASVGLSSPLFVGASAGCGSDEFEPQDDDTASPADDGDPGFLPRDIHLYCVDASPLELPLGETREVEVLVENTSDRVLMPLRPTLDGSGRFELLDEGGCEGAVLSPGETCTSGIRFDGAETGEARTTFGVQVNGEDFQCELSATVVAGIEVASQCPGAHLVSTTGEIDCGNRCSADVSGPIELEVEAPEGLEFEGWSGDCIGTSCTLEPGGSAEAAFSGWWTTDPQPVPEPNGSRTVGLRIAIDAAGRRHVVTSSRSESGDDYGDITLWHRTYAPGEPDDAVLTKVSDDTVDVFRADELTFSVDASGRAHLVYARVGGWRYVSRTPDGAWLSPADLPAPTRVRAVAMGPEGSVHVVNRADEGHFHRRMSPAGLWEEPTLLADDTVDWWDFVADVDVSGRLHVAFQSYAMGEVGYLSRSKDGAWTDVEWTDGAPSLISTVNTVLADAKGEVHVVFSGAVGGTQGAVHVARQSTGGWTAPELIGWTSAPMLVERGDGRVLYVYNDPGVTDVSSLVLRGHDGEWGNPVDFLWQGPKGFAVDEKGSLISAVLDGENPYDGDRSLHETSVEWCGELFE